MRRFVCVVVLLLTAIVAAPAMAKGDARPGRIVDFEILPPDGPLTVGDSIAWTNEGGRPHTVTDRGGLFDTGAILPGEGALVQFDVPGTYEIFCQINPSKMNARVVVQPGDTPPTAVRVQAFDEARTGDTKRFDPDQLEVSAGTRVILANVGGLRHSLKAEDGSFAIPIVDPGDENGRFAGHNGSVVVNTPGTHAFFCEIHPAAMKGTLVVTAKQVVAAAPTKGKTQRPPPKATTSIAEFAFTPTETLVAPGGAVTWTNNGSAPHTATFDDVELDTGRIEPGKSATLTAPGRPGTYSYFCAVHPAKMRGVLVVSPEPALAATTAAAASPKDDAAGHVFAWLIAVLVVGVGAIGLFLGVRPAR
jgi:plastocyanin